MRKLLGCLRKAVEDFDMIAEGDNIVVGLSGGKDSLALLTALKLYQRFSPISFNMTAVTIDLGFKDTSPSEIIALNDYCDSIGVELVTEKTNIGEILFEIRREKNPCSLCAKMRRGALNSKAVELGANKLALGHHSDDALETMLLSFIYEGRLSTLQPVSFMDRMKITLIRPFLYASEEDIVKAVSRGKLPVLHNPCPVNHLTQREYMKDLVKKLASDIPYAKERMSAAVLSSERYNLIPPKSKKEK